MGRPPSPISLAQRRRAARQKYQGNLARRGLVVVRLMLPAKAAERLRTLAATRSLTPGALVAELLPAPRSAESPIALGSAPAG